MWIRFLANLITGQTSLIKSTHVGLEGFFFLVLWSIIPTFISCLDEDLEVMLTKYVDDLKLVEWITVWW